MEINLGKIESDSDAIATLMQIEDLHEKTLEQWDKICGNIRGLRGPSSYEGCSLDYIVLQIKTYAEAIQSLRKKIEAATATKGDRSFEVAATFRKYGIEYKIK